MKLVCSNCTCSPTFLSFMAVFQHGENKSVFFSLVFKFTSSSSAETKSFSLDCGFLRGSVQSSRGAVQLCSGPEDQHWEPWPANPSRERPRLDTTPYSSQLRGSHTQRTLDSGSPNLPSLQNNKRSHCSVLFRNRFWEGPLKSAFQSRPLPSLLPKFAPNQDTQ